WRAILPVSSVRRRPPHISSLRYTSVISLFFLLFGERHEGAARPALGPAPPRRPNSLQQLPEPTLPSKRRRGPRRSATEPQAPDQRLIARRIDALQIIEQA